MDAINAAASDRSIRAATGRLVEVDRLSFAFPGGTPVLAGISFAVEREQFVSFIGPSGCGKTTLLYLLLGLHKGHEGSIRVSTESVSFVFQHDSLLEWRDAVENVLLPLELRGVVITPARRNQAEALLDLVGLSGYGRLYPAELSGGMKKRVEIARALITEPELLVLDEPFSSLDIISRERLNLLLKRLHREKRSTIIMVTHSVEEACFLSDRVYVLAGRPASILKVEPIKRRDGGAPIEHFALSKEELSVNASIRADAKSLWNASEEIAERTAPVRPEGAQDRLIARMSAQVKRRYNLFLIPIELVLLFAAVTFIKLRLQVPDFIFPAPGAILRRFFATIADGSILGDLETTLFESAIGFLIAFSITLLLGYAIAKSRLLSNLAMPYLIALNTIPSVALAPFLVLWFGFGIAPKIITCIIVMFFPMLINNIEAITLAAARTRTLVRFYRPSALRTFLNFELPGALPIIASGIKVSITLSVIGAVVGEFISGHSGLGSLVNEAKANFDMELMFVGLLWLSLLGLCYFGIASLFFALIQSKRRTPAAKR